jgi:PAS domain S-box-containing protein
VNEPIVFENYDQDFYRTLFNVAGDSIIVCSAQGFAIEANQAALEMLACTRAQFIGSSPMDWAPEFQPCGGRSGEMAAEIFSRVAAGGVAHFEWVNRRADGVEFPVEVTVRLALIEGRTLFVVISRDIIERKRNEAALTAAKHAAEDASRRKSNFLAAASHDLRQPMQAIRLFNDALIKTGLNGEQEHLSHCLSQSVKSLGEILNALLDISKLDAGAVKASPEAIPVDALVREINAAHSPVAAEKSLRFIVRFPMRQMSVMTDGKLLASLLGNLIGNAIKYTVRGGIVVATRRRGSQALIQVWDTGIGIAAEHLDSIYEEYVQIGNPARETLKGLGLGLAIAQRIARLLGTEVVCRSKPGQGSVFEFRLPLISEEASAVPIQTHEAVRLASAESLAGRRIVVVEDDVMAAKALQVSLASIGVGVSCYASAEEALASTGIAGADFYVTDFRLPGLNGIELLDAIQRRAAKPIKAILLTGDTFAGQVDKQTKPSPWTVLFKPTDLESLVSAIKEQDIVA